MPGRSCEDTDDRQERIRTRMNHRYIVWTGHYRGRHYREMHIIGPNDAPICAAERSYRTEYETVYEGRPQGYALCRYCARALPAFEQAEKLRTWQELAT